MLDIHPKIRQFLQAKKIHDFTEIQKASFEPILNGRDVLISSPTGTGKTYAYAIPALQKMAEQSTTFKSGALAIVVLPTRELAHQTFRTLQPLGNFLNFQTALLVGGQEIKYQAALLRKDPALLVATPGRLIEHLDRDNVDFAEHPILILDEADRMLDMGFKDEVLNIVERLPNSRQNLLLSATLNHGDAHRIAKAILNNPIPIDVSEDLSAPSINHFKILSDGFDHKKHALPALLERFATEKTIVFCNKRADVEKLAGFLRYKAIPCLLSHGEIAQDTRKEVMNRFRQSKKSVLVTTDVAARGLDVENLGHVINFDTPRSGKDYTHRVGRTGRMHAEGSAYTFVTHIEWDQLAKIQKFLGVNISIMEISGHKAAYKGPKKIKSSGKAAKKKKRSANSNPSLKTTKSKQKTALKSTSKKSDSKREKGFSAKRNENLSNSVDGFSPPKKKLR